MSTTMRLYSKRSVEDRDQAVLQLIPRDQALKLPRVDMSSANVADDDDDDDNDGGGGDDDRDDVTVRVASAVGASTTSMGDSCQIVDASDDDDDEDDVVRLPGRPSILVSDVEFRVPTVCVDDDDDDRVVIGMRVARDASESFSATSSRAIAAVDASSSLLEPPARPVAPPTFADAADELCWSAPARACARLLEDALDDEPRGDAFDEFDIDLEMPAAKKRGGARASRLRLKVPLDVRGALSSKRAPTNEAAKRRLLRDYRDDESDWWFVLERGQHLLFDGVGANEQFVNDMVSKRVPPGAVMTVVSCEHPNTNMKQLLMALAHVTPRGASVLRGAAQQGVVQQARKLAAYLDALALAAPRTVPFYLVMHAIDAPAMNQLPGSHDALGVLCACRLMRVVATARSPRVALLWSHTVWRRMRWHSVPLSTLLPIRSELVRVGRHRAKQHASTRRSAVLVLSSVSSKARQIFAAFLRALLKHADEGGVKMSALYDDCHARFLVASMQELRQQLVEFRTHALITAAGSGFSEKLACSLAPAEMRLLLADIDELERGGIDAVDDDEKNET